MIKPLLNRWYQTQPGVPTDDPRPAQPPFSIVEEAPKARPVRLAVIFLDMQQDYLRHCLDSNGCIKNPVLQTLYDNQIQILDWVAGQSPEARPPVYLIRSLGYGDTIRPLSEALESRQIKAREVTKYSNSGFERSGLEQRLESDGCGGFLLTGVNTPCCFWETAEHAARKHFQVITAEGCHGDFDKRGAWLVPNTQLSRDEKFGRLPKAYFWCAPTLRGCLEYATRRMKQSNPAVA